MQKVFIILSRFETYANLEIFESIFGKLGVHLWNQFRFRHNQNIVSFFCGLDIDQEKKLITYLNKQLQSRTSGLAQVA